MVSCRRIFPAALRSRMMFGLASKTIWPSYGGTSAVNLPPGSSGCTTSMPAAVATSMSSSPKAGARWTIPVPESVVT